jgi:hypothetical protein
MSPGSGAERIRTVDPLPAEQVLYQLSYSPRSRTDSIAEIQRPAFDGPRVAGQAADVEVPETRYAKDLVAGSGIEVEDRGSHGLKGVPGEWRLWR